MGTTANLLFGIEDYHAVKSANIVLDGITVIAGENGCGKSTISRWLYYLVNGMQQYEQLEKQTLLDELELMISPIRRLAEGTRENERIADFEMPNESSLEDISKWFDDTLKLYKSLIESTVFDKENEDKNGNMSWTLYYRRITRDMDLPSRCDPEVWMQSFDSKLSEYRQRANSLISRSERMLSRPTISELFHLIQENYRVKEDPPNFSFYEDGVNLIDKYTFEKIFPVSKAIYIDTALSPIDIPNISRRYQRMDFPYYLSSLLDLLHNSKWDTSEEIKELVRRISFTIRGDIDEKEQLFGESEFRYLRRDGLDIPLTKAATGIKLFAVLYRLLQNGHLDKETLLIIDEPESHLHPQWVVECARMLVLIHMKLGTRILIASHDPDMVAAIQAVAIKEKLKPSTHFYIANDLSYFDKEKKEVVLNPQYEFKDLGIEIGDIFNSFNIALERIDQYGGSHDE